MKQWFGVFVKEQVLIIIPFDLFIDLFIAEIKHMWYLNLFNCLSRTETL